MRKLVGLFLLLCLPVASQADAVDDFVRQKMQEQNIPGLAMAIMRDGVLVRAQGYGYANLEHHVPVHVDTIFQSGSIGKMFTATAIMLMVEDGKLVLDDSIRKYLPEAPKSWAPITVRHVLNHTSGLAGNPDIDLRKDYTDDELLQVFYGMKLDAPAGQQYSYSNTGYELLGILVKKVGGASYIDVLENRVFGPLNMQTAGLIDDRGIVPNRAAGYEVERDGAIFNQEWVSPTANSTGDGALYLTVLDFAKWEAAVRAGKVLKPESWAEVFKPARLNSGKTYPYGFAWRLQGAPNGPLVHGHGGAWQGFRSNYIRFPKEGLAVVLLANGTSAQLEFAQQIAGMIDPRLALPDAAPIADSVPQLTERLRKWLPGKEIPNSDRGQFDPDGVAQRIAGYAGTRAAFGKFEELQLFHVAPLGDDQFYLYRARFDNGVATARVLVSGAGLIKQFVLIPAAKWNSPLS